jgi:hypothetical protein
MFDWQRERFMAAQNAFQDAKRTYFAKAAEDAKKAYSAQASKHVVAWWMGDGPPPRMPEPLTRATFAELIRLREAAKAALAAYRDVLDER